MKKEDMLNLMNAIPPDLIEEADVPLPNKRRLPKAARTGLIAACLCLVLLGTAFAAAPEAVAALIDRLTVRQVSTENNSGYLIEGQMVQYPLSAFSPALLAASEGRETPAVPVSLFFDTWDEVQAFLGRDIPCVWPEGWDTDWFQVTLFHTELEVLWGIQIYSVDLGRQAEVNVKIYTEHWPHLNDDIAGLLDAPETSIEHLGSYPMPNGAIAELIQVTDPETVYVSGTPTGIRPQSCSGYFMRDGILYSVTACSPVPPQEDVEAQLKTVLDSFP